MSPSGAVSGNDDKPLSRSEDGRQQIVCGLWKSEYRYRPQLYAYELMGNPFHLLAPLNAEIKP